VLVIEKGQARLIAGG